MSCFLTTRVSLVNDHFFPDSNAKPMGDVRRYPQASGAKLAILNWHDHGLANDFAVGCRSTHVAHTFLCASQLSRWQLRLQYRATLQFAQHAGVEASRRTPQAQQSVSHWGGSFPTTPADPDEKTPDRRESARVHASSTLYASSKVVWIFDVVILSICTVRCIFSGTPTSSIKFANVTAAGGGMTRCWLPRSSSDSLPALHGSPSPRGALSKGGLIRELLAMAVLQWALSQGGRNYLR
jgi:hypothetical protein